jgi:hypothetical protein
MKKRSLFPILMTASFSTILAVISLPPAGAQQAPSPLKVGTYDSRVITLAYSRSAIFQSYISRVRVSYDSARKAGDTARMKQLNVEGMTLQHLLHQRVFGTGSVNSLMALVSDQLPALAEQAGVTLVMSQWEIDYKAIGVELVDMTNQIAALFKPLVNIDTLAAEIRKTEPIPLEQLSTQDDEY